MKPFARMILVSSLAFAAAVGNDVYAEVEKSSDITWYSPVGVSFMDIRRMWRSEWPALESWGFGILRSFGKGFVYDRNDAWRDGWDACQR